MALAVGGLGVARVERLDVDVVDVGCGMGVVEGVVEAEARVDGPDVGVPVRAGGDRGGERTSRERAASVR